MHSFKTADVYCHSQSPLYLRNVARYIELGELEQSIGNGFYHDDADNLSRSSIYSEMRASNVSLVSNNPHFGGLDNNLGSAEIVSSGTGVDAGKFISPPKGTTSVVVSGGGVADHSQQTDISTDMDDKNQYPGVHYERSLDSLDHCKGRIEDQKALRRLAQNREAAKKSRMRKKAYVQQLENSRQRLTQLEQELKKTRQQKVTKKQPIFVTSGFSINQARSVGGNGALAFDLDYARWLDEHQRLMIDLRSAVNFHAGENELRILVDGVLLHYNEIFRLKSICTKSDVFHILSGMWKTPAERCFMWLGGFRSSDILKILRNQIEPLNEQQLMGFFNLQQSSQQAEDALSQGMEAWQQSLIDTLSSNPRNSLSVVDYMTQMAIAMSKLATIENFIHQADLLRQQTLQQLRRILTTHQAARALLAIGDYKSRLRALNSLWLARPTE